MLPKYKNSFNQKGVVDPFSLISLGFLVITLLVGSAAVSNPEMAFDIRNQAKELIDGGTKTLTTLTTKKSSGESCGKGSECKSGTCVRGVCTGSNIPTQAPKSKDKDKEEEKKSTTTTTKEDNSKDKDKKEDNKSTTTSSKEKAETKTIIESSNEVPEPTPTLPPPEKDRFGYVPTEEEKKTGPSYYSGDKNCNDGKGFISGTYCTPTGERRLVGKAATIDAYNKHVEAAAQIYSNTTSADLLKYAKDNNLYDCKEGDKTCEQEAITKAEEKKMADLVIIEPEDKEILKQMRAQKESITKEVTQNISGETEQVIDTSKLDSIYAAATNPLTTISDLKNILCKDEPDKIGCLRETIDEKTARENVIALLPAQYREETRNAYKQQSVLYDYSNPTVTDSLLKKKYCGGVAICEAYFSRDMILTNLTPENQKIAVEAFKTNFSNPEVIAQIIDKYNEGNTSDNLTTINKVLQINKNAEQAFYAFKAEYAKNSPLTFAQISDEELAKQFYNQVYVDPVKLKTYSDNYKADPQAYKSYARSFGTDTKTEVNAGIVGYVNQLIETSPISGLTDNNGKLLDINSVSPDIKQKAFEAAKKDYMTECIKNAGVQSCERAFTYDAKNNTKLVNDKLASNAQYYLNQILEQERGSARLSASFSNLASIENNYISQKLREEALRKAKEMILDPTRSDLSFYSGLDITREGVVSNQEALADKALLDQIRTTGTGMSTGIGRVQTVVTIDENDPKTKALIEQLANEYLERQFVDETYVRGAGMAGALTMGAAGAAVGSSACIASGIGALGSPVCGVIGGLVGGISGAVSNFIPIWGQATSEEIAKEKEWITTKLGNNDLAGTITQSLYSSQGAASFSIETGSFQVGRSSSAINNQFALMDTILNPSSSLSFDDQIRIAPLVLDKWDERQVVEQKQAYENIAIAAGTGALFGGAGGNVAKSIAAGTKSIALAQGGEALSQTAIGFGLNYVQNSTQFNQNQGNVDLLSTPTQIELKNCKNKGLDCTELETKAQQERSQAFTQTMTVATIMDTALNAQQGIIAYKNTSKGIANIQNKINQGVNLSTEDIEFMASIGLPTTIKVDLPPAEVAIKNPGTNIEWDPGLQRWRDKDTGQFVANLVDPERIYWDTTSQRWRNKQTGEFVSQDVVTQEQLSIPKTVNIDQPIVDLPIAKIETDIPIIKPEQPKTEEPKVTAAPVIPTTVAKPDTADAVSAPSIIEPIRKFATDTFNIVRDFVAPKRITDTSIDTAQPKPDTSEEVVPKQQQEESVFDRAPPPDEVREKGPEVSNELLPTISIAPIERSVDLENTPIKEIDLALDLETLTPKPGFDYKTGKFNVIELIKNIFGKTFRGDTMALKRDIEMNLITKEEARSRAVEISGKYLDSDNLIETYVKSVELMAEEKIKTEDTVQLVDKEITEPVAEIEEKPDTSLPVNEPRVSYELSREEVEFFNNIPKDNNQNPFTRAIAVGEAFKPLKKIAVDGKNFYLSQVLINGRYKYAIMYSQDPGTGNYLPRVLYKSNSDGVWRSTPGYDPLKSIYSKGEGYHYTQETKLNYEIAKFLDGDSLPSSNIGSDLIREKFNIVNLDVQGVNTFKNESVRYNDLGQLKDIQKFKAGVRYLLDKPNIIVNSLNKIRYPNGFVPDFNKGPVKTEIGHHTLLGDITYEFYEGKLSQRSTEWIVAYDKEGRVWIDSIHFKDGKVNSYGTPAEVIDSGALTNKPLDYHRITSPNEDEAIRLAAMRDELIGAGYIKEFDNKYNDITPLLANLKPIQDFKAALASRNTENNAFVKTQTESDTRSVINTAQNALGSARKGIITGIAVTLTAVGLWLGINTSNITPKLPDIAYRAPAAEVIVTSPKQEYNLNLEKVVVEEMAKPQSKINKTATEIESIPLLDLSASSKEYIADIVSLSENEVINSVSSLSYFDPEGEEIVLKITGKAYKHDVEVFDEAMRLLGPLSDQLNNEIEFYRVSNGSLGNKIYGEASSWVNKGELNTRISYTNEYSTESHLLTKRSGIPEEAFTDGSIDAASMIHEITHTMKMEWKDGKYQTSDFLIHYMNVFHKGEVYSGDMLIDYNPKEVFNETAPTKYSQSYEKGDKLRAASEDLSDAVALYFTAPEWLKEHQPIRYAYVDFVVKGGDPKSFIPVEVNGLGQAVIKESFEPIASLPLGGSDTGKAIAALVLSITNEKTRTVDSKVLPAVETGTGPVDYIAPTDLVVGSNGTGCSECSIVVKEINERVKSSIDAINELIVDGKYLEAKQMIDKLDFEFNHKMDNKLVETGIEAQKQALRLSLEQNGAEKILAIRKMSQAIDTAIKEIETINDPIKQIETMRYIEGLRKQKRDIEATIVNDANLLDQVKVFVREVNDSFQELLNTREEFVFTEEDVDWKYNEVKNDPYVKNIIIPDINSVKQEYNRPSVSDNIDESTKVFIDSSLDIMERYSHYPIIEDIFLQHDREIEIFSARSEWQYQKRKEILEKYGEQKADEMFRFLKDTQLARNRIAAVITAFSNLEYLNMDLITPRGREIYADLVDNYFSQNPNKNYDTVPIEEKYEVNAKVKELIKETYAGIEKYSNSPEGQGKGTNIVPSLENISEVYKPNGCSVCKLEIRKVLGEIEGSKQLDMDSSESLQRLGKAKAILDEHYWDNQVVYATGKVALENDIFAMFEFNREELISSIDNAQKAINDALQKDKMSESVKAELNDIYSRLQNIKDVFGNNTVSYDPDDTTNKLIKYITGIELEKGNEYKIVNRMVEDHFIIKNKYGLPSREERFENPSEYLVKLRNIAQQNRVPIRSGLEYQAFFEKFPLAGAVCMDNGDIVIPLKDFNDSYELDKYISFFEHELIHALQQKKYPGMPIETKEYEAYVGSNMSTQFATENPIDVIPRMFGGMAIGGSVEHWYLTENETPSWK